VLIGSSAEPGYADTQALPGNHYQYAVSAYDRAPQVNESAASVPSEAATTYKITRFCPSNDPGAAYDLWDRADINNQGEVVGYFEVLYALEGRSDNRTYLYSDETWTDLSALHPGMVQFGELSVINDAGQVITTPAGMGSDHWSALYSHGVMTQLGTLGGNWVRANDINQSGQIVGSSKTADGRLHAFIYQDGVMTDIGTAGWAASEAWAINDAGTVVGTLEPSSSDSFRPHAFRYSGGVMTDLGDCWPGDPPANAVMDVLKINKAGQILCRTRSWSSTMGAPNNSYILDGDAEISLDFPAWDINDAGQVIGDSGTFYDGGQTKSLGIYARDINNVGQVVGSHTPAPGESRLVIFASGRTWDVDELVDAGDPAKGIVHLQDAYRISDSGTIIARGYDESDDPTVGSLCRAYLLTLAGIAEGR
jgi:probable HAF family extracellular repeat protein